MIIMEILPTIIYPTRKDAIEKYIIPELGDDYKYYDVGRMCTRMLAWHTESYIDEELDDYVTIQELSGYALTHEDGDDRFWEIAAEECLDEAGLDAAILEQIRELRLSIAPEGSGATLRLLPEWERVVTYHRTPGGGAGSWSRGSLRVVLAPCQDDEDQHGRWSRGDEYLSCEVSLRDVVTVENWEADGEGPRVEKYIPGAYAAVRRVYEAQEDARRGAGMEPRPLVEVEV